jgi:hypothetical protein
MTPNELDRFEQQLFSAGTGLRFPQTPDLAAGFWKRLGEETQRSFPRQAWGGLAAAVVAIAVVMVVSISPARDAAADLVNSINFFETNRSTRDLPTDIAGEETTLERAQTAIGKRIPQPDGDYELEKVLLQGYGEVQVAALFYTGDDASFVLFASNAFVGKGIPTDSLATIEEVDGLGKQAFWVEGERIVYSIRPNGSLVIGSERLTDRNALLWEQDEDLYRIEGDLDREEAIAIARSLR